MSEKIWHTEFNIPPQCKEFVDDLEFYKASWEYCRYIVGEYRKLVNLVIASLFAPIILVVVLLQFEWITLEQCAIVYTIASLIITAFLVSYLFGFEDKAREKYKRYKRGD